MLHDWETVQAKGKDAIYQLAVVEESVVYVRHDKYKTSIYISIHYAKIRFRFLTALAMCNLGRKVEADELLAEVAEVTKQAKRQVVMLMHLGWNTEHIGHYAELWGDYCGCERVRGITPGECPLLHGVGDVKISLARYLMDRSATFDPPGANWS